MKTNGNFQMGTKVVRVISGPAATWYAPATVVEVLEDGDFVLDHMPSRRWSPRGDYAVTAEDEVEVERVVVWITTPCAGTAPGSPGFMPGSRINNWARSTTCRTPRSPSWSGLWRWGWSPDEPQSCEVTGLAWDVAIGPRRQSVCS